MIVTYILKFLCYMVGLAAPLIPAIDGFNFFIEYKKQFCSFFVPIMSTASYYFNMDVINTLLGIIVTYYSIIISYRVFFKILGCIPIVGRFFDSMGPSNTSSVGAGVPTSTKEDNDSVFTGNPSAMNDFRSGSFSGSSKNSSAMSDFKSGSFSNPKIGSSFKSGGFSNRKK